CSMLAVGALCRRAGSSYPRGYSGVLAMWCRSLAVFFAALALLSCQTSTATSTYVSSGGKGVITGGIIPCSGLPPQPNSPHYAAGKVTVFKGRIGSKGVSPT